MFYYLLQVCRSLWLICCLSDDSFTFDFFSYGGKPGVDDFLFLIFMMLIAKRLMKQLVCTCCTSLRHDFSIQIKSVAVSFPISEKTITSAAGHDRIVIGGKIEPKYSKLWRVKFAFIRSHQAFFDVPLSFISYLYPIRKLTASGIMCGYFR